MAATEATGLVIDWDVEDSVDPQRCVLGNIRFSGGTFEQNSILVDYEANRTRSVLAVDSRSQYLLEGVRSVLRGVGLAVGRSSGNGDSGERSQQEREKRYLARPPGSNVMNMIIAAQVVRLWNQHFFGVSQ